MPRRNKPYRIADGRWRTTFRGELIYGKTAAEVAAKLAQRQGGKVAAPASVAGAIDAWIGLHPAPNSVARAGVYAAFAGATPLAMIGPTSLYEFRDHLTQLGRSAHTVQTYMGVARSILTLAHRRGWIRILPDSPQLDAVPRSPKPLTPTEIATLLDYANRKMRTPGVVAVIRFMLATGARPGEACALDWSMFDGAKFRIPPAQHKTGKATGTARLIMLSAEARACLPPQRSIGHVFTRRDGQPLTPNAIRLAVRRAALESLGYALHPYQLRHTFATIARRTLAPDELQGVMGHSHLRTTQIYYERDADAVLASLQSVSILGGGASPPQSAPSTATSAPSVPPAKRRARPPTDGTRARA